MISHENLIRTRNSLFRVSKTPDCRDSCCRRFQIPMRTREKNYWDLPLFRKKRYLIACSYFMRIACSKSRYNTSQLLKARQLFLWRILISRNFFQNWHGSNRIIRYTCRKRRMLNLHGFKICDDSRYHI